jgi:uncharacterized protein YqeY
MATSALKQSITDAMKAAMRAREKERLGVIRLMLAEFKRIEVDERIELDDARVLTVLDKMSKQRRDSAQQFTEAGRQELADQENFELTIIAEYLPEQLSEEALIVIIDKAIADSGAESMRDMGKAMGLIKPQVQGRADMGLIGKMIKSKLG